MKGKGVFQMYLVPDAPTSQIGGMKKMSTPTAMSSSTATKTLIFGILGGLAESAHKMGHRDLKMGMMMMMGGGSGDADDDETSGDECSESAKARPKCGTFVRGGGGGGGGRRGRMKNMMGNHRQTERMAGERGGRLLKGDDDNYDDDWACIGPPRGPRRDMKQRMPRPASSPITSAPASP